MVAHRCTRHGLGAGPDGLCAICRREIRASSIPPPIEDSPGRRIGIVLGLALSGLCVVAVTKRLHLFSSLEPAPQPIVISVAPTATNAQSATAAASAAPFAPPTFSSYPIIDSSKAPSAVPSSVSRIPTQVNPSTSSTPPAPSVQPSASDVQRVVSSIPISLFEADWCPHCRRAKAWFSAQRLNVTDYDVDNNAQAKQTLLQYNPRGSLPTILVGNKVLIGFSEDHVAQALAAIASQRLGAQVTVRAR